MKEFLPEAWLKTNKIEKRILGEHRRLSGTSEIDAKARYVKLARSLPTFGVHFFLVKVRETTVFRVSRAQFGSGPHSI